MLNVFIAFLKLARCVYEVIDMSKPKGRSGASRPVWITREISER